MRGAMVHAILVLLVAVAVVACGRKAPPLVPGTRAPRPVSGLTGFIQDDGSIRLTWTNPTRRADNVRLRDLLVERVYRMEDAGVGAPKPAILSRGRIAGYSELLTIRYPRPPASPTSPPPPPPPLPPGVTIDGDRVNVSDRSGLKPGFRYTYVVIAEDSMGRESAPSSRVSLTMIAPPAPPARLTAQAGEGEVRLSWEPPTLPADDDSVTGTLTYEVLRAPEPEAPLAAITPVPIAGRAFTDRGVANDHTYEYAVRSILTDGATSVRGSPSARVSATPRDVTPPAPPARLAAVPSTGTVRLRWEPSPDADVARYVVYRAERSGEFTRIGSVAPPTTVFVDRDVPTGTYRYTVTAVDAAATPNESARSNEVSVRVP
jgi:hypothetical protein